MKVWKFRSVFTTIIFCMMAFASTAFAAFDPYEGPEPIAVLIEQGPWLMVMGSDTPRVAIYENGDVIFFKADGESGQYRFATLDKGALENMIAGLSGLSNEKIRPYYPLSGLYDAPTLQIFSNVSGRKFTSEIYGMNCEMDFRSRMKSNKYHLPDELSQMIKGLCDLDMQQSERWTPKYIEVMLWDYDYAPDKSVKWLPNWPDLESDRALKRGDSWSIFLDGSEEENLKNLVRSRPQRGAILLDRKKWAISYRYTFPSEPIWLAEFR